MFYSEFCPFLFSVNMLLFLLVLYLVGMSRSCDGLGILLVIPYFASYWLHWVSITNVVGEPVLLSFFGYELVSMVEENWYWRKCVSIVRWLVDMMHYNGKGTIWKCLFKRKEKRILKTEEMWLITKDNNALPLLLEEDKISRKEILPVSRQKGEQLNTSKYKCLQQNYKLKFCTYILCSLTK